MTETKLLETENPKEKALLIGVSVYQKEQMLSLADSLEELSLLADTAGVEVVGQITQNLTNPNPKTYIGSGKVEEVKALADEANAEMVIFDNELSPRHQRELEREPSTLKQMRAACRLNLLNMNIACLA